MMRRAGLLAAAALTVFSAASAQAQTAPAAPCGAVTVAGLAGTPVTLSPAMLAALPQVTLHVSFDTDHGPTSATFQGPLLWTVLVHEGAVSTAHARDAVRQVLLVTGRDGYSVVLALGEIAPPFEGKQAILADSMDGRPLGPGHWRVVIPGEHRGGRDVRDVARLQLLAPQA
jgi:hypothetical protein